MHECPVSPKALPQDLSKRLSFSTALAIVAFTEIAYWFAVRLAGQAMPAGWGAIELELIRTVLRIAASLVLIGVMTPRVFKQRKPRPGMSSDHWPIYLSIGLCLLAPAATSNMGLTGHLQWLYSATSLFVGIHEELLWRAFVVITLARYAPMPVAIAISSLLFSAWHYGMFPSTVWNYLQAFLAGVAFSLLYLRTGSLWVVVGVHSLFDIIVVMSPLAPFPLAAVSNPALLLAACLALMTGFNLKVNSTKVRLFGRA